jgi:NAD(P)-dependent dehydrogenase (short-subunit alcohol dehydrogenase family)
VILRLYIIKMTHNRKNNTLKIEADEFAKEIKALQDDASSIRGSDAKIIIAKCEILAEKITQSKLHKKTKNKMLNEVETIRQDSLSEDRMEQYCSKWLRYIVLSVTFGPMLLTFLGVITERMIRHKMIVSKYNLNSMTAIVTGGCGDIGSNVVLELAKSGCNVIAACHSDRLDTNRLEMFAPYLQNKIDVDEKQHDSNQEKGGIQVWPLDLASFSSVTNFTSTFLKYTDALNILIHAAVIKEDEDQGCSKTEDGNDLTTQINYLAPFLLSKQLMPSLRKGESEHDDGGRIVYITCQEGLILPDFLPWPFRRRKLDSLPTLEKIIKKSDESEKCSPSEQYRNSKLAIVVHSHDLDKRFERNPHNRNVVSNVVDPGALDNHLGRSLNKGPPKRQSLRAKIFGWLPPVWILKQVYNGFFYGLDLGSFGLRSIETGTMAVIHVATSKHLADRGGNLYSDSSGIPFINCGLKSQIDCGRVSRAYQPAEAQNIQLGSALFKWTKNKLKNI